jgi:hypothetical protein
VALFNELEDDIGRLTTLQIDRKAANVPIRAEEKRAHIANRRPVRPCPMPFERTIRRLYLDNLCAHVGEILHGSRPLQIVAETDHLDPVEQRGLRSGLF